MEIRILNPVVTDLQLTDLQFTNRFLRALPADSNPENCVRTVTGAAYSKVAPTPVQRPELLAWSENAAALLGLASGQDPGLLATVFSGNRLLPGMEPFAACYGGHQFGHWAGQLGDGRAIGLGEVPGVAGDHWEVQLKGAGPTPYSRHADGRAVLRSSVREFLCSEAMFHLGVPTTRALCLVTTGEGVVRDMFYDGHPQTEPGAIVTRLAPTFLRFGNYELPAARRDRELLKALVDFTLRHYFPHLGEPAPDVYMAFFHEVVDLTLTMIVHWMRVGFVHGVMNTDNLSVLGLTIDYGPYGWLDSYDPGFTPNTTDSGGRYCYANQPRCAAWNLACLANALVPLVGGTAELSAELEAVQGRYEASYQAMMQARLGLEALSPDTELIAELQQCLLLVETDMTCFFRSLSALDTTQAERPVGVTDLDPECFYANLSAAQRERWNAWLGKYQRLVNATGRPDPARRQAMEALNPWFIPRNYLVHQAIEAAERGDLQPLGRLMEAMRQPYVMPPHLQDLAARRPDWARDTPGCSALSCSS